MTMGDTSKDMMAGAVAVAVPTTSMLESSMVDADLERRFGGLRRLYGGAAYARLRALRVAVVGLGGVGSWAVEALARSGVAGLTLIDMDHVAESNVNRQVQATSATLGMAKGEALAQRIRGIHPGCDVTLVDAFVDEGNWPALLPARVDVVVDACDQVRAKVAMASWSLRSSGAGTMPCVPLVCTGAAGGKQDAAAIEIDDLARVTHDPLLAALRSRLRRADARLRGVKTIGVRCVFSREPVVMPRVTTGGAGACGIGGAGDVGEGRDVSGADDAAVATDGSLNCHGYGSSVMVTASFGMAAAAEAVRLALAVCGDEGRGR
jgi:tRNA A37 threonylcarbamoyladenosine dehydratase